MNLEQLAQALIDGQITIAEWQAGMREFIRTVHREAAIISMGGVENMTQAMWGYEGYLVKLQYQFLDGFAQDIINNPNAWLNGRLLVRMRLYEKAGWGSFEQMLRWKAGRDGWTEEMRELGEADHCNGCLDQAEMGWQPIGTLDPIGAEECSTNCHCVFRYRKPGSEGKWDYESPKSEIQQAQERIEEMEEQFQEFLESEQLPGSSSSLLPVLGGIALSKTRRPKPKK